MLMRYAPPHAAGDQSAANASNGKITSGRIIAYDRPKGVPIRYGKMMNLIRLYDRMLPLMRYGAPLCGVGLVLHILVDKPWVTFAVFVLGAPVILVCLLGAACAAGVQWGRFRCPTCGGRLRWDIERISASMREAGPFGRPRTDLTCEQCRRDVEFSEAGLTKKPAAAE
jgi:hypothetical protein